MTSLYDEVAAAPGEGVATRRITLKVNGEDRTVDQHLDRHGATAGVGKLGQEGQHEQAGLRVEHVGKNAGDPHPAKRQSGRSGR